MRGLLIMLLIVTSAFTGVFASVGEMWNEHERGWFWYEVEPDNSTEKQKPAVTDAKRKRPVSYAEMLKRLQKQVEEIRARALLNPTPENVAAWYLAQALLMQMAGRFTRMSLSVPLLYPELDISYLVPHDEWSTKSFSYMKMQERKRILDALAGRGVLVIFYRERNCFLCQRLVKTVNHLKRLYGFRIYAFYYDKPPLGADKARPVKNEDKKLGVKTVPALFFYDGNTHRFYFLSYGIVGTTEAENRLLELASINGWYKYAPAYDISIPVASRQVNGTEQINRLLEFLKKLAGEGYHGKENSD